jgi:hypothetical protein
LGLLSIFSNLILTIVLWGVTIVIMISVFIEEMEAEKGPPMYQITWLKTRRDKIK